MLSSGYLNITFLLTTYICYNVSQANHLFYI